MPRVRGPHQGPLWKATFDGWARLKFEQTKTTKVLLLVNIRDNKFCTEEYFAISVKSAITQFKHVTILIADEVNWHNFKNKDSTNINEAQLKSRAIAEGGQWLDSNIRCFIDIIRPYRPTINTELEQTKDYEQRVSLINTLAKEYKLHFEIKTWAQWRKQQSTEQLNTDNIKNYLESDENLKSAYNATASVYAKNHSYGNYTTTEANSLAYLIEECPLIMIGAVNIGANFILYPGDISKALKATRDFFVLGAHNCGEIKFTDVGPEKSMDYANWLHINFKRAHNIHENGTKPYPIVARNNGQSRNGKNPYAFYFSKSNNSPIDGNTVYWATKAIADSSGPLGDKKELISAILDKAFRKDSNTNSDIQVYNQTEDKQEGPSARNTRSLSN